MGDPAGIGSEIILKSIERIGKRSIPVIIGDMEVLRATERFLSIEGLKEFKGFKEGRQGDIEFIDIGLIHTLRPAKVDPEAGLASYRYIMEALKLIFYDEVSGLVTCPINKESINRAGIKFIGHTEMLAYYSGVKDYVMMMSNREMRCCLVTTHIPLKAVPAMITKERVLKCIMITNQSLKTLFSIKRPLIKACGLNPHAGEAGIIGSEETEIEDAIEAASVMDIDVKGPFPADTLFHKPDCDAYIAMYHDQGLIPVKTTDFRTTINTTLGLPFIRTSPGHGTGYDIAGRGIADPTSLIEAYRVAEGMAINLKRAQRAVD